jgi:Predicted signal transduction protein with a C-terminal ATPase domain
MLKKMSHPLLIGVAVSLFVTGLAGILLLYGRISRLSEMDVLHSLNQAVKQAAINLSDRMSFMEETMRLLLFDVRMQESLTRSLAEETLENQLLEIKDLRDLIYLAEKNNGITRVRVHLDDAKMITREGINFFGLQAAKDLPEYASVLSKKGTFSWIGEHPVQSKYYSDTCITLGCLYRAYYSPEEQNWAVILLDLSTTQLTDILNALVLPNDAQITITDASGEPMFGSGDLQLLAGIHAQDEPFGFIDAASGDGEMAFITQPLSCANWRISAYMPRTGLLDSRESLRQTLTFTLFGLTFLMIAFVGFIISALYARGVARYIRALNKSLKTGDGSVRLSHANAALFALDKSIGELLETNKRLAEDNYRARLREREITLKALQAQINPHFLYNTLDTIHWMAMREGARTTSDMVATLAEYFRLSLSRGRSTVTLREDIAIAEKYLSICSHRYDYVLHVEWHVDENAAECLIPKLTLQPLIENALQHGILRRAEKKNGLIRITAMLANGEMTLRMWDNGPGLGSTGQPQMGFGLSNVKERLDLYALGSAALHIENAPNGGTVVTVTLPQRKEESS